MKKLIVTIILLLSLPVSIWAAPSITAVSGSFTSGSTINISGSDFGATGPTIHKWDNFEGDTHTIGNTIGDGPGVTAWTHQTVDENKTEPIISAYIPKTNSNKFVRCGFDAAIQNKYDSQFYLESGTTLSPCYMTLYLRWDDGSGGVTVTDNEKFWRICHDKERNFPYFRMVSNPVAPDPNGNINWYMAAGTSIWQNYKTRPIENQWVRVEYYGVQSGTTTQDGSVWVKNQLTGNSVFYTPVTITNVITTDNYSDWNTFAFGEYVNAGGAGTGSLYYHDFDDIYIANSQARIEIGDNSTFTDCIKREIQIPASWSASSITATINTGSFANGESVYFFVIDSSGVASTGKGPYIIGSGTTTYKISGTMSSGPKSISVGGSSSLSSTLGN